jgi:hypothetical protein
LEVASEWIKLRDRVEVDVEPQHMQDGCVCSDRNPHPTVLDGSQSHDGHPCSLRDELSGQSSAQPRRADPLAQTCQASLERRE